MKYTHAFIFSSQRIIPIEELALIINEAEVRRSGFALVYEVDRLKLDQHGRPCHRSTGWSYGHIQNGHICAGAGGLNSLPVMKL